MDLRLAVQLYNSLARHLGWLPVNIETTDAERTLHDAADRCERLMPNVAQGLRRPRIPGVPARN